MTCRSFEGQGKGGRGGGNGKGGREHITRRGGKARDPERECHVACSPPRYSPSLFLSWAVYVGRQEWRQEATPPPPPFLPSSSPTLLQLFTHSVTHSSCLPRSTTTPFPFPLPHPTFHPSTHAASSPFSGPGFCCMNFPNCTHRPHTSRFVCLPSPTGVPVHHNSLGVEVR